METQHAEEVWMPVKGFEPRFKISNHGRLLSIGGKFGGEFILPLAIDQTGYRCATMRMKPLKRRVRVHTLVAEHFIGPKPDGQRMTVNHKDGNKLNNHVSNLEWIESVDNVRHAVLIGLMDFKGEKHPQAKLTEKDVLSMRKMYAGGGMTQKEIGAIFGVCRRQVGDVINGKNWGWLR